MDVIGAELGADVREWEVLLNLKAIIKRLAWLAAQVPPLRAAVIAYFELRPYRAGEAGWNREHPYDRAHGVRTSGAVPGFLLKPGAPLDAATTPYVPAQPSIIRAALAAIPEPQHSHFLDIGCGKGRPLLIATEFGFASITGVELSPTLARIARRNAAAFLRANPQRTRIDVVTGDALAHKLPEQQLVVFLYHPFVRPLMAQFLANIEACLRASRLDLYIVYYNPVWADAFDSRANLERRYAAQFPYDAGEIGYGPDESYAVVVWQNRGNPPPKPPGIATAPVIIVSTGIRAELPREGDVNRTQQAAHQQAHRRQPYWQMTGYSAALPKACAKDRLLTFVSDTVPSVRSMSP